MEIPIKKIVRLLRADQPADVRAAAALILGELGVRDADAMAEVAARLTDDDPDVRLRAIKAAGQLRIASALPMLLEKVAHGGPEASVAADAAASLGAKGIKGLQDLMHAVAPGVRRYIAAALTGAAAPGADAVGVSVLLDKDPAIANAAAAAIIANIPSMPADRRSALAEEVLALAGNKKKPLSPSAELPVVRVLVALREPVSADVLWDRVLPPHSPDVRAAALQAVGGWIQTPTREQWRRLFLCASDADFRVAAPALMILSRMPVTEKMLPEWVSLLHAPDVAARRLGIEKVGEFDIAEVAQGLMAQFNHNDRGVRDAARSRLQQLKSGRKAILVALQKAESPEDTWQFARVAAKFAADIPPATRKELATQASQYLEKNDHRADAILFLLRESDSAALQELLMERAVALRKKKKYELALTYLKVLARDPSIGFAVRLELAFCALKISPKELDPHARNTDPCLRNFETLFQQDSTLLKKEMEKAKFLDPEDVFYVGFHFAEQVGRAKDFGIDLLKLVLKRSPKREVGKSAKNKLKSVGG
jgi:hypothetical protein